MPLVPAYMRALGEVRADFASQGGRTQAGRVFETGGLRLRFPNAAPHCEAVMVNTGGGVAGGDSAQYDFTLDEGAAVTFTTTAAEKIYRAQADASEISVSLRLAARAEGDWLPQETILFDGARLQRRLDVDMASDARLTLVESVIFGRMASGELQIEGSLRDRWRIRRDRQLIFAEEMRIEGDITGALDRPAVGGRSRATATCVHVAPDAEGRIEDIRQSLSDAPCDWGASAWNGMAVVRLLSPSPEHLRAAIVMLLQPLRGRELPRVWQT
jgi:urease accessory protein